MGLEVILNNIANWLQLWSGRHIFKRTRLRHQYKERLVEVVNGFADAMADRGKTSSLISVITEAMTADVSKNVQIQGQLKAAQILGKWYSEYKGTPKSVMLRYISLSFDQFARILYETHSVFNEFFQVIANDEVIRNKLKSNSHCYPYFEKIYNRITMDFEELCKEARKTLGDEFKVHQTGQRVKSTFDSFGLFYPLLIMNYSELGFEYLNKGEMGSLLERG